MSITRLTQTLLQVRTVDMQAVAADLFVFRAGITGVPSWINSGLCRQEAVTAFLAGETDHVEEARSDRQGIYAVYHPGILPALLRQGFHVVADQALMVPDPIEAIEAGVPTCILEVCMASHIVYDLAGAPVPSMLQFGYIGTDLDDGHYDLRKVREILVARPDVTFGEDDGIHSVPYHNRRPGRDAAIAFQWNPSAEHYRQVVAACGREAPHPGRLVENALAADLLGLSAARR